MIDITLVVPVRTTFVHFIKPKELFTASWSIDINLTMNVLALRQR